MLKRTALFVATLTLGCILVGCDRKDAVQIDPSSPASYMHDKEFMARVDAQDKVVKGIRAEHARLRREYDRLKAADPASPRLSDLDRQMKEKEVAFQKGRKELQAIVRARLTPRRPAGEHK